MYKLIGVQDGRFTVVDTDDGVAEEFEQSDLHLCLICGVSVAGCHLMADGSFGYTSEYFGTGSDAVRDQGNGVSGDVGEPIDNYIVVDEGFGDLSDEDEVWEDDEAGRGNGSDAVGEDGGEDWSEYYDDTDPEEEPYDPADDEVWVDDDVDAETPEESTVSKLYGYLTDEQVTVLKRYYLWYSQRLFTEAQKDPSLGMKSLSRLKSKKQALSNLRNTGGLWHYAGFVDMGYRGGGHCTLGHPLRFMHLAWDVTVSDIETAFFGEDYSQSFEDAINSNNCIVFGIKCIADFFEVNSECVSALQKAQRESLKDMGMMCQYYEAGKQDEVAGSFGFMDALVGKIKGLDARKMLLNRDAETILPASLTSFYLQFRGAGMIPPKSLVQEIRDKLVGWSSHKFSGHIGEPDWDVFIPKVQAIFGRRMEALWGFVQKSGRIMKNTLWQPQYNLAAMVCKYLALAFMYKSCGWYEYNADTNKDEGGASKVARGKLYSCYTDVRRGILPELGYDWGTVGNFLGLLDKWLPHVGDFSGYIPMAAVLSGDEYIVGDGSPDDNLLRGYSDVSVDFRKVYEMFDTSARYRFSRLASPARVFGAVKNLDTFGTLLDECIELKESCVNGFREWTRRKAEEECDKLNAQLKKFKNAPAVSCVTAENTVDGVLNYLKGVDFSLQTDSGVKFAEKILEIVTKSGKAPTDKQFYYLKSAYEKVSGQKYGGISAGDSSKEILSGDLETALRYMVQHKDLFKDDKTYDICCSIVKYGSISQRQMKYAVEAKRIYDGLK